MDILGLTIWGRQNKYKGPAWGMKLGWGNLRNYKEGSVDAMEWAGKKLVTYDISVATEETFSTQVWRKTHWGFWGEVAWSDYILKLFWLDQQGKW